MEKRTLTDAEVNEARAVAQTVRRLQKRRRGREFAGRYLGHAANEDLYGERIELAGWRVVGSGLFSKVLGKAGVDYVIKVSGMREFGYTEAGGTFCYGEDPDCWPHFARYCMTQEHQHLPRIWHLERMGRSMHFALMERLEPCPKYMGGEVRDWRDILGSSSLPTYSSLAKYAWLMPIRAMHTKLGFRVDLHSDNVMARYDEDGEPVPVMTDPFSWPEGDTSCVSMS